SALLFWVLANSFLSGLQWLIYVGGEKGWLIHLQRWYYCAILLQIAGTLIEYFSFFV
ncbi:ABC transporter permease, partial [Enterococcus faecalis]